MQKFGILCRTWHNSHLCQAAFLLKCLNIPEKWPFQTWILRPVRYVSSSLAMRGRGSKYCVQNVSKHLDHSDNMRSKMQQMQTLGSNLDGLLLKFLVPNKFREGCHFIPTDRRCAGPAVSSTSRADGEPDCYGRLTNEIPWDNMTYQQTKTYSKITNQSVSKISVTTLD